ncbi:MAG: hypothetical protein ACRENL_04715 [Candidatus Dormibacteria bacterium]
MTTGRPARSLEPSTTGLAVGRGPVYPLMYGPSPSTAAQTFSPATVSGGPWQVSKVPWFARRGYTGPIVVRGAQIDGTHPLRFDSATGPEAALELTSANAHLPSDAQSRAGSGWHWWPSGILVESRGCYALQIDATNFSIVVVFLALVDVPRSPEARVVSGGCDATVVYQGGPPTWFLDAAGGAGAPTTLSYFTAPSELIGGFIFGYPLRAGHPGNPTNKILWAVATPRDGSRLDIEGHPLSAPTPVVSYSFPDDSGPGEIYPSIVDVPSAGCWEFSLTWGTGKAQVELAFAA